MGCCVYWLKEMVTNRLYLGVRGLDNFNYFSKIVWPLKKANAFFTSIIKIHQRNAAETNNPTVNPILY